MTFSLTDGPAGAQLTSHEVPGGVALLVTSPSSSAHAVSIAVSAPEAQDPASDNNVVSSTWTPHVYEVQLSNLRPAPESGDADRDGMQRFKVKLERDDFPGQVTLRLVSPDGDVLSAPADPGDGTVSFAVTSTSDQAHDITLVADVSGGFSTTGDTATGTWTPHRTPSHDVRLGLVKSIQGDSGKGTVAAVVTNVFPGTSATLTVTFDATVVRVATPSTCTAAPGVITCSEDSNFSRSFPIEIVGRANVHGVSSTIHFDVTGTGYDETDDSNNHGTVVLTRR